MSNRTKQGLAIREAIAHFNYTNRDKIFTGRIKSLSIRDLSRDLFPDLTQDSAEQKMSKLQLHNDERVSIRILLEICRICGVDLNFLIRMKPMK